MHTLFYTTISMCMSRSWRIMYYAYIKCKIGIRYQNGLVSVISWRSVLLVDETRVPRGSHRSAASHWRTLWHNVASSAPRHEQGSNSQHLLCSTQVNVNIPCDHDHDDLRSNYEPMAKSQTENEHMLYISTNQY